MSNDQLSGAERAIDYLELGFPILFHPEAGVIERYGVYDTLSDGYATPSVFVIDKSDEAGGSTSTGTTTTAPPTNRSSRSWKRCGSVEIFGGLLHCHSCESGIQGYHVLQSPIDLRRTDALTLSHAWEKGFHPSFRLCIRQATWISAFARMTKGELSVGHTIPLILSSDECRESR